MDKQELEQHICQAKDNLRRELPRLISCIKYLRELKDSKTLDIKNSMPDNEHLTRDQLINPVLRALGYRMEYSDIDDPKLDVWVEVGLDNTDTSRVDYAIYLDKYPRMIIEAKALRLSSNATKQSLLKFQLLANTTPIL